MKGYQDASRRVFIREGRMTICIGGGIYSSTSRKEGGGGTEVERKYDTQLYRVVGTS
jgi:hypothetical protein